MSEKTNKKTALAAAAAKKAAAAAPALDEDFGDEAAPEAEDATPVAALAEGPAEPEVRTRKDSVKTRKDQAAERAKPVVKPTDDFVRDKNGKVRKDEDGDDMRLAAGEHERIGYVNEEGVLFPNGYLYKGGHVMNGAVVLNRCPRCGHHQSIDEALSGTCGNLRAGVERQPCGFNKHSELAEVTVDDL